MRRNRVSVQQLEFHTVLWLAFKSLILTIVWYIKLARYANPFYVISCRQKKIYHVTADGQIAYKPAFGERVVDIFRTDATIKRRLLNWVRKKVPKLWPVDLTTSWHDGILLCTLIDVMAPGCCARCDLLRPQHRLNNCRLGLRLAQKELDMPQGIITAEEMATASEHTETRVRDLIHFLQWVERKRPESTDRRRNNKHLDGTKGATSNRIEEVTLTCVAKGGGLTSGVVGKRAKFFITTNSNAQLDLEISILGPHRESCSETIRSLYGNRRTSIMLTGIDDDKLVDVANGKPLTRIDDCTRFLEDKDGTMLVRQRSTQAGVDAQEDGDLKIPFDYQCVGDNTYVVSYIPRSIGRHVISIKYYDVHIPGSPFTAQVKDTPIASRENSQQQLVLPTIQSDSAGDSLTDTDNIEQENCEVDSTLLSVDNVNWKRRRGRGLTKQRTVTKRRILKRVVTKSGKEIALDVSPSASRRNSGESSWITDMSDAEFSDQISDIDNCLTKPTGNESRWDPVAFESNRSRGLNSNTNETTESCVDDDCVIKSICSGKIYEYADRLSKSIIESAFNTIHEAEGVRLVISAIAFDKSQSSWEPSWLGSVCERQENSIDDVDQGVIFNEKTRHTRDVCDLKLVVEGDNRDVSSVSVTSAECDDGSSDKELSENRNGLAHDDLSTDLSMTDVSNFESIPLRFKRSFSEMALKCGKVNDGVRVRHISAESNHPTLKIIQSQRMKNAAFYIHQNARSQQFESNHDVIDNFDHVRNQKLRSLTEYLCFPDINVKNLFTVTNDAKRFTSTSESMSSDAKESEKAGYSSPATGQFLVVSNPAKAKTVDNPHKVYFNDSDDSLSSVRRKSDSNLNVEQGGELIESSTEKPADTGIDVNTSSSEEVRRAIGDLALKKKNFQRALKLRQTVDTISSLESMPTDSGSGGKVKPKKMLETIPRINIMGKCLDDIDTSNIVVPKAKVSKSTQVTYDVIKLETLWKSRDIRCQSKEKSTIERSDGQKSSYRVVKPVDVVKTSETENGLVNDISHLPPDGARKTLYNVHEWLTNHVSNVDPTEDCDERAFNDNIITNNSRRKERSFESCHVCASHRLAHASNCMRKSTVFHHIPSINVEKVEEHDLLARNGYHGHLTGHIDAKRALGEQIIYKNPSPKVSHSLISFGDDELDENSNTAKHGEYSGAENYMLSNCAKIKENNWLNATQYPASNTELLIDLREPDEIERADDVFSNRGILEELTRGPSECQQNKINNTDKRKAEEVVIDGDPDFRALFVNSISDFSDVSITATFGKDSTFLGLSNEHDVSIPSRSQSFSQSLMLNDTASTAEIQSANISIFEQLDALLNADGVLCDKVKENGQITSNDGTANGALFCKATGLGLYHGTLSGKNNFQVHSDGAGHGILTVGIRGPRKNSVTETSILYTGDNLYEVTFTVNVPGYYVINIRWSDCSIPGSPYICKVTF